jgi:hypothetical protein
MPELTRTENNFIFLLRAALAERAVEVREILPDGDASEFDARGILRLAYSHKLWHMILSVMPRELIPEGIDRRSELFRRVAAQVTVTSTFIDIWSAMTDAGFHPIVVKGIVCRTLYLHPELRPSSDEDLYISGSEFEACCEFLESIGMNPDKKPYSDFGEIGWYGKGGLYIELHRDLFEGEVFRLIGEFFDFDSLPKYSYPTHYDTSIVSMTPHDHFLYLLLHAYKHFVHSGFGIRQICDIGIWAREYGELVDWQKLGEQCDRVGIRGFVKAVLGIAKLLEITFSLPDEWKCDDDYSIPMLTDVLRGGIYGLADTDRVHSSTMTLNAVSASKAKKEYSLIRSVFPSKKSLEGRYPYLKKHPILLPVAWCTRILSYAKRSSAGETHAAKSIAIGKERIELLRFYGLIE